MSNKDENMANIVMYDDVFQAALQDYHHNGGSSERVAKAALKALDVHACNALPRLEAENARLREALAGLYADQMDYIRLNHLSGAENNHWMVIARAALGAA